MNVLVGTMMRRASVLNVGRTHRFPLIKESSMTVKFIHIRATEFKDNNYRVAPKGGMTIAYKRLANGSTRLGVAVCCQKDHYNMKTGRIKAKGRILSHNPKWAKTLQGDASKERIILIGKIMGVNMLPLNHKWNTRHWVTKYSLDQLNTRNMIPIYHLGKPTLVGESVSV